MAWSAPPTVSTGDIATAAWANGVRDNLNALRDYGTLASRPSAASIPGLHYFATDTYQEFVSDNVNWWCIGKGAWDDFARVDSATITPSASGNTWAEVSGTWNIASNVLCLTAGSGHATLDNAGLTDGAYRVSALMVGGATKNSVDLGLIVKYVDSNNYVYVRLSGTDDQIQIRDVTSGSDTARTTQAYTVNASTGFWVEAECARRDVIVKVFQADVGSGAFGTSQFSHANFEKQGTKVGVRLVNTQDSCSYIKVEF